jgi:hypothetical protein
MGIDDKEKPDCIVIPFPTKEQTLEECMIENAKLLNGNQEKLWNYIKSVEAAQNIIMEQHLALCKLLGITFKPK